MWTRYKNLPLVSITLVCVNVIVFLICIFTGGWLYYLGGLSKISVVTHQQYGRILWSMFLHDDTSHLFNNMIILLFLGSMLEKEVGHVWFFVTYFLSGIGGNLVSLYEKIVTDSDALSIGASGAVFGLDGLLLALVLCSPKFRNAVPPIRVFLVIGLSLYDGFTSANIDNAAHVGGLAFGFAIGLVISLIQDIQNKRKRREVRF